tara:strand:+ start:802 stop:993 length:192 start_codon:yes stop_codon:yes gene_type:complete
MGLFDWIELILDILENPKGCLIIGLIIVLCVELIYCSDPEDESIGSVKTSQSQSIDSAIIRAG